MLKCAALAAVLLLPACSTTWNYPNVLLLKGPNGETGSGVVIVDGWILTAKHMLPIITADGMPCGEAIPHPDTDLALVPCAEAKAYGLRPAAEMPQVFERVYTYSWHQGDALLKTEGYQAQQSGWMSAPVIYGCSGGAVVNDHGELVGVIVQVAHEGVKNGWGVYAVSHMARYTVLDAAVREWIGANIR
jgi:hypothetical protein